MEQMEAYLAKVRDRAYTVTDADVRQVLGEAAGAVDGLGEPRAAYCGLRVLRSGTVMHDGTVSALRRFKDDVREVAAGYECGVSLDGFNDFQEGDQLEFYHSEKVAVA